MESSDTNCQKKNTAKHTVDATKIKKKKKIQNKLEREKHKLNKSLTTYEEYSNNLENTTI